MQRTYWHRLNSAALWLGLALTWVGGVPTAGAQAVGPSGGYLLRKAETLGMAGQYDAAAAAYSQAAAAFHQANDADGQLRATTQLAALEEKRADNLLATLDAPVARSAPTRTAVPTARLAGALPPGPTPVAGKVANGRPLGLFFMTRYIPAWHSLEKATWYFAPGGQVYHNPTSLDAAGFAALKPGDRGTYQAGAAPTVKWADGRSEPFKIETTGGNSFNHDMGIFVGMGPFGSAQELVGNFQGGNSVTGAAVSSSLELHADGTYRGGFAASISASSNQGKTTVGNSGDSAGRWSLNGWVLSLTNAQGRTTSGVAYPIEKDEKTGRVVRFYFNNVAYARQ
ncbi:hypothetical protein [Hymenobacter rubidus]|uniref:hypothetical protein n=1 Tax=Hymenobacter rubidus TaxID=1441626 RepID=UPI00191D246E|nr:hypothetical protein [Hymenobacter rubidus]